MKDLMLGVSGFAFATFLLACSNDTFSSNDGGGDDASRSSDGSASDQALDEPVHVDAGKDTGPAGFSCAAPAPGTLFCDDFDTQTTVSSGFTAPIIFNGGTLAFDATTSLSPPRSAHADIPINTEGNTLAAAALLFEDAAATYKTMSIRAAVRIHAADVNQYVPLLSVSYASSLATGTVAVTIGTTQNHLGAVCTQVTSDGGFEVGAGVDLGAYTLDQWFVLALVVDTSSAPAQLTAYVDLAKTTFVASLASPKGSVRDFQMGLEATGAAETSVEFDDFACTGN